MRAEYTPDPLDPNSFRINLASSASVEVGGLSLDGFDGAGAAFGRSADRGRFFCSVGLDCSVREGVVTAALNRDSGTFELAGAALVELEGVAAPAAIFFIESALRDRRS